LRLIAVLIGILAALIYFFSPRRVGPKLRYPPQNLTQVAVLFANELSCHFLTLGESAAN